MNKILFVIIILSILAWFINPTVGICYAIFIGCLCYGKSENL